MKTILLVDNSTWNLYNFRRPIMRRLQSEGYRVIALAPFDAYAGLLAGPRLIPLRHLRPRSRRPLADLMLLAELYGTYRRLRPDLVLHFTVKPNIYGSLAAGWLDIPSVAVVTGLGYPFLRNGWLQQLVRLQYRLALHRSRQVVCYNPDDRNHLLKTGLIRPDAVALIPGSGVDVHHFQPVPVLSGIPFRFLFIGRLLKDKGVNEYVAAAKKLSFQYPQAEWWILGGYDPQNPASIRPEEMEAWQNEPGIHYAGQVRDVRPYLQNSRVVVLPSYREGIPRSLLEAMAMARPLITTDVAGCREVVENGQTGWLVPPRDVDALADAMESALLAPSWALRRMGRRGRKLACRRFTDRTIAGRFAWLVDHLLRSPTRQDAPHAPSTGTYPQRTGLQARDSVLPNLF